MLKLSLTHADAHFELLQKNIAKEKANKARGIHLPAL
jgi:hypothetical protein